MVETVYKLDGIEYRTRVVSDGGVPDDPPVLAAGVLVGAGVVALVWILS